MTSAEGLRPLDDRVLVLAPTAKDAAMTQHLFAEVGVACTPCATPLALCAAIEEGAGTVILTEHACALPDIGALIQLLRRQPPWSDLPVVVLARGGAEGAAGRGAIEMFGNVTVLERPVQMSSLASVVRTLIRSRRRQYQTREYLLELERARDEAERASRMKDEFLATLSHELRTPLNAILGWAHILSYQAARGEQDGDLSEGLAVIERNARAQTQIIEDLLEMSRVVSGKVRLDVQRIDLAPVVRAAVETVTPAAQAKGVRIETLLGASEPVAGDAGRLQQVFWNLLSNAVKFTPRGGRVQVLLRRVDSHVEVSVIDTGEGIRPEFLPHVFERFRQADASSTRQHGGLGLGLAIVKQLVELHGGTVQARSLGKGHGATFVVSLPLATAARPEPAGDAPARSHPDGAGAITTGAAASPGDGPPPVECPPLDHVRVLVVDDEPDARALVKRLLEDCHATVVTAGSASEALALLRADPADVLVSDIGMPGEDGYSLIRRVRALPPDRGGATPAIALTAYARAEDRLRAVEQGFQMHLAKPVEPAELITMVTALAALTRNRSPSH